MNHTWMALHANGQRTGLSHIGRAYSETLTREMARDDHGHELDPDLLALRDLAPARYREVAA